MMTLQEVFDKSVGGVIEQGRLAKSPTRRCAYRFEVNATVYACAVGQVIDDAYYSTDLEGMSMRVRPYSLRLALTRSGVPQEAMVMLAGLQEAHDGAFDIADFRERAIEVGKGHDMDVTKWAT